MSSKTLTPSKRGANPDRLNAQQQLFIEALFADRSMNASKAAKVAGYKGVNAAVKLQAIPAVKATIQKRMQEIIWEHRADRERIIDELMSIAFMNPQDLLREDGSVIPLAELPQRVARTISRMKVSYSGGEDNDGMEVQVTNVDISFHDKLTAVELLMRHLGLMDAVKHEVKMSVDWNSMVVPHANPEAAREEADRTDPIEARIKMLEQ